MAAGRCPGPVSRREFLQVGTLALGGMGLADVLAARAAAGQAASDTSVILFWCYGGPTQLETYDLKPDAPSEYRSVYSPIRTNVPGMDICELFPRQAKLADKLSIVRSLHHTMNSHSDGHIEGLTGKTPPRPDPTSQQYSEHPDFGMIAAKMHGAHASAIPRFVATPSALYYTRPTYLGVEHKPFVVGDPSAKDYSPPHLKLVAGLDPKGLDNRRGLLEQFDRLRRNVDLHGAMEGTEKFRELAFRMLTNPATADAFDITKEDDALRDRYGRHQWGQSCLLARRLAERGTSVVSILAGAAKSGYEYTNWDDHPGNNGREGHFAKYVKTRLPYMDEALAALIEDIYERGLEQKIMLVVVGEFGRTPMIRKGPPNNSIGRDHWPQAYSAMLSGGGLRMGQVVGATNSKSEYPAERPLTPRDLLATIYRHLDIDPRHAFYDFAGRPIPILPDGEPIRELV
jgi:uncharacterized protein (DUF1501 family)